MCKTKAFLHSTIITAISQELGNLAVNLHSANDFLLLDLAGAEKKRVEEKQRVARKNRSKSNDEWKTR